MPCHDFHSPEYVTGLCVSLFLQESESLFAQIVSNLLVLVLAVGGGLTCYKLQTACCEIRPWITLLILLFTANREPGLFWNLKNSYQNA